jgi:hypothetical protein
MPEERGLRERPEAWAAAVNGIIVLSLPLLFVLAIAIWGRPGTPPVKPPGSPSSTWLALPVLLMTELGMLPLALIAAWRTWVYAERFQHGVSRGWEAVAEAGLVGVLASLWMLAGPTLRRPLDAPPYLLTYGGMALLAGLLVGLVLRASAVLVLRRTSDRVET